MAMAAEQRLLGQMLAGKYRLVEIQGAGAFGTVFKAHQFFCKQFVRPVAVKVSRQTHLTEQTASYLFSDALLLAQLLSDPRQQGRQHLVPILDLGLLPEYEGRGYLVMEYVEGHPLLSHILSAGQIGVAVGLRYLKEICRALAFVHAQGAVHRDLKPDNILVDRQGVVRVVDFGLAAFTDPKLGFAPGSMGTYTYMAPETLLGRSTPAADVYGLGLIAYELFTGGGPHLNAPWPTASTEDSASEHYRIKIGLRFPPPSASHNEIRLEQPWVDALILRCLHPDPARRFQDAGELLAAIERCEQGEEPPPVESAYRSQEISRPLPAAAAPAPAESQEDCDLLRQARRLLAGRQHAEVISLLSLHRPAEWEVMDRHGARLLRLLGQAYLGKGDLCAACDCLEQLRAAHKEHPVLPVDEYAVALNDLVKCYHGLGHDDLAGDCQAEAQRLVRRL